MTQTIISATSDPEARARASWAGRLAQLISRGASESDAAVIECRAGLAYWRCRQSIDAESGNLSRPGVDRLVLALREAVG